MNRNISWSLLNQIILYLFIFAIPVVAESATYYVSTGGSDSNVGTESSPWKTIQKCASMMSGGDTCIVKDGTYTEKVTINRSGEAGKIINLRAENKWGAVVGKAEGAFEITGSYIRIDGFKATGMTVQYGTCVHVTGSNVHLTNLYVDQSNYLGVHLRGTSNNLSSSYFYKCQFAIQIMGSSHTIENNEVYKVKQWQAADADYMRFFGSYHIIRNNYFHGTDFVYDSPTAHVDCFQNFDNNAAEHAISNVVIEHNWCSEAGQGMMLEGRTYHRSDGLVVRNNVFANYKAFGAAVVSILNAKFYNNTFAANGGLHGVVCGEQSSCEVKNNIFYNLDAGTEYPYFCGVADGSIMIDGAVGAPGKNNLLYSSLRRYTGFSNDVINKDPLFINPATNNFKLRANSPAKDAGRVIAGWVAPTDKDGVPRPQGIAWDIGAYEYRENNLSSPSNFRQIVSQ